MRSKLTSDCGYIEEHPLWSIPTVIFHIDLLHIVLSGVNGLDCVNPFPVCVWSLT